MHIAPSGNSPIVRTTRAGDIALRPVAHRPSRRVGRVVALVATIAVLALTGACGETPTELSPLARALGDVRGAVLSLSNLQPLGEGEGIYELWAIDERGRSVSLGRFQVNDAGQPVGADGEVIERFTAEENIGNSLQALVTIQTPTAPGDTPSGNQILQGVFIDGVADLTVPAPPGIEDAGGSFRVFTPTDGPGTNEGSGLWAVDAEGEPSLSLPDRTVGYVYEAFLILNGVTVIMGRFEDPEGADTANNFGGEEPAPEFPGEDFLQDPPEGLVFPADLTGGRLIVTLEALFDDAAAPSQLVFLEATLPAGLAGGETIQMINRAMSFPTGTVVLF